MEDSVEYWASDKFAILNSIHIINTLAVGVIK